MYKEQNSTSCKIRVPVLNLFKLHEAMVGTSNQVIARSKGMFETWSFYNFLLMSDTIEHSSHLKNLYCLDLHNTTLSWFSFSLTHCQSHPITISSWYAVLILLPLLSLKPLEHIFLILGLPYHSHDLICHLYVSDSQLIFY